MPFVVTEACIQCKYTDCVTVCPMDCFFEGPNFMVIHPDECIDCSICVAECPVGAIVNATEIPEGQKEFIELNARLAQHPDWTRIRRPKPPMSGHEKWASVQSKRHLLQLPQAMRPLDGKKPS